MVFYYMTLPLLGIELHAGFCYDVLTLVYGCIQGQVFFQGTSLGMDSLCRSVWVSSHLFGNAKTFPKVVYLASLGFPPTGLM